MKALGLWLGLLAAALSPVSAQVTVEVTQDQDQFLPGESMPTAVRITNRSGQSLRLGQGRGLADLFGASRATIKSCPRLARCR